MKDAFTDIWFADTRAMVPADSAISCWDENFIDPDQSSGNNIAWTKQNFVYMRLFHVYQEDPDMKVQMYITPTDLKSYPQKYWMPLYTDCNLKEQAIRKGSDSFAVNAHPYILSGLYDWTDYTLIGYYGNSITDLPEKISDDYFKQGLWAFRQVNMEQAMPVIVNYSIPKEFLREKRLRTQISYKSLFSVEIVDSMIRELHVEEDEDSVLYDGVGKSQITEMLMLYCSLKPDKALPARMEITTQKMEENRLMDNKWEDLTFARKYHVDEWKRKYKFVRSTNPDCGILHKYYVGDAYGGKKEWTERITAPVLKMPIARLDDGKRPTEEKTYETEGEEIVQEEINVDYPSVLIFDHKPEKLNADIESLELVAEKRKLQAGSSCFLTAAVWYGTTSIEQSDSFVVYFYHALKQYKRVPGNWVPLMSPSGEQACLEYLPMQPNERALPKKEKDIQYFEWEKVPRDGYLIVRITDTSGKYNPIPEEAVISEDWFEKQSQWAFIEISEI